MKDEPNAAAGPRPVGAGLRPLAQGRVADRVVAEIRDYITANDLQPGHRLPPERVFIERLGVGRSSLREALRVLATTGLIEVRHGDGMYVSAAQEAWRSSAAAIFDATEEHALRNLVETRLGVELAATIAATMRATDEDLDQLHEFLETQARALEDDPDYEWEPLAFELALIEMSGNTWLYDIEVMLHGAWLELSAGLRSSVGRQREWLSEQRAILASVRSRNVAQA
ncbi:MAG TPA: GntR family transcriptional regulator, partial [Pseudonocardiaceae bacterium]|nr:GntR family transcriptional regulator [Pseudonocardiaceae bacterium]